MAYLYIVHPSLLQDGDQFMHEFIDRGFGTGGNLKNMTSNVILQRRQQNRLYQIINEDEITTLIAITIYFKSLAPHCPTDELGYNTVLVS